MPQSAKTRAKQLRLKPDCHRLGLSAGLLAAAVVSGLGYYTQHLQLLEGIYRAAAAFVGAYVVTYLLVYTVIQIARHDTSKTRSERRSQRKEPPAEEGADASSEGPGEAA